MAIIWYEISGKICSNRNQFLFFNLNIFQTFPKKFFNPDHSENYAMDDKITKKNRIINLNFSGDISSPTGSTVCENIEVVSRDLVSQSRFRPCGNDDGPYEVEVTISAGKLIFRIIDCNKTELPSLILSIRPYMGLIRDYFMLCESFLDARANGNPSRLEAIDMGRRALHNEGADLLLQRLADKIEMDHKTARRLFTLICVLHGKSDI